MAAEQPNSIQVAVSGMTCDHCEIVVERLIRAMPGVREAHVNYRTSRATILADADVNLAALDAALREEGYSARAAEAAPEKSPSRRSAEAAAAIALVLATVLLAKRFDLMPHGVAVSEHMTLGLVFIIGLVASVSSCMAVTGGLLVALAAKYNEASTGESASRRFVPHIYFNTGRILSYTGLGALIGLVGSAFTLTPLVTAALTIIASALMIGIGAQMLGILPPLTRLVPAMPKATLHRIHDLVASQSKASAFVLGAGTFFLPCGFTLALQLYVLAQGNALTGALTMLVFALGTLPALVSLSALSSFATGRVQTAFLKIAGASVIVLGLLNIQFGLVQAGTGYTPITPFAAAQADATPANTQARQVQVVEMTISGLEYRPNRFTVKAGLPVEWRIDGRDAEGCGRILVARGINLMKFLASDKTEVITFTPQRPGEIAFNCSMGMMTPNSGFTVTN